jgi:DinB family protein
MNAKDAIKMTIDDGKMISTSYVEDLTDQELLHRPCQGANHINWQLGHLIAAEHDLINKAVPGSMPPLPVGFAEKYTKDTAASDNPATFLKKAELLKAFEEQRAGTLAALAKLADSDLAKPSGIEWAPTVASLFSMQGTHWVMHAGQWAVIRRQLGRKPLF